MEIFDGVGLGFRWALAAAVTVSENFLAPAKGACFDGAAGFEVVTGPVGFRGEATAGALGFNALEATLAAFTDVDNTDEDEIKLVSRSTTFALPFLVSDRAVSVEGCSVESIG